MSDTQSLNHNAQTVEGETPDQIPAQPVSQDLGSTLAQFRRGISSDIRKSEAPKPTNLIHYIYDSRTHFDNSWMERQLHTLHQLLIHNKQALLDAFYTDYGLNKYEVEIMEYNPVGTNPIFLPPNPLTSPGDQITSRQFQNLAVAPSQHTFPQLPIILPHLVPPLWDSPNNGVPKRVPILNTDPLGYLYSCRQL